MTSLRPTRTARVQAHIAPDSLAIIRLSVADQHRFAEMMLNPASLAPAMKRALKNRNRLFANGK
jgi:uncharacterized protein (DUF1778 family)